MDVMDESGSLPAGSVPVQPINSSSRNYLRKYKTNVIKWFSVVQAITGALMIMIGILDMSLSNICIVQLCFTGYGIWCGLLYLSTGVVGMCSVKFYPKRSLVLANMAMNIASASLSIIPFQFGIHDIAYSVEFHFYRRNRNKIYVIFPCLLLLFALIEVVIAIISAAFGCKALCQCCNDTNKLPSYAFFDRNTRQFVFVSEKQGFSMPGVGATNEA